MEFQNTIDYLQADIDSLKDAYKTEKDNEKATVYSSRILEHKKAISLLKQNQALQLHKTSVSDSEDVLEVYPFENVSEEYKKQTIEEFVKLSAKHTLQVFRSFGLKTHIETMIIDDNTKEEFIYSFKKVEQWLTKLKS